MKQMDNQMKKKMKTGRRIILYVDEIEKNAKFCGQFWTNLGCKSNYQITNFK